MSGLDPFTIVIPTRDDPKRCQQLLESLAQQNIESQLSLRITFLVNDTNMAFTNDLEELVASEQFSSVQPHLFRATKDYATAEENIRLTLGGNLDKVSERFIIIGNSDSLNMKVLCDALKFMQEHELDLLLVGGVNVEVYEEKPIRQEYGLPRHMNPKNRLSPASCYGTNIFADAMLDYGPIDYLTYIGCQIYTKNFFREICDIELPEPLYSIPLATLDLTTRKKWMVGFYPEIVAIRIDHLQDGPNSSQLPPNHWVFKHRTDRGQSQVLTMSIITNSLCLSEEAFKTLVNCHTVSFPRGSTTYVFGNFLYGFVLSIAHAVAHTHIDSRWRFSASELQDIVNFGRRIDTIDIGLPHDRRSSISTWFQRFDVIGDYSQPEPIRKLILATPDVLRLLDSRPGKERWIAQLQQS